MRLTPTYDGVDVVRWLPPGAVVSVVGEAVTASGAVRFHRIRTLSGLSGWTPRSRLSAVGKNDAELRRLRDAQYFENRLRETVIASAAGEISHRDLHPLSRVQKIQIMGGSSNQSSAGTDFDVRAIMVGRLMGFERFQVDLKVNVFVKVDEDYLSNSVIEPNTVVVVSDTTTRGMLLGEKIGLLKFLLPAVGVPFP